jgi:predicted secreted protein
MSCYSCVQTPVMNQCIRHVTLVYKHQWWINVFVMLLLCTHTSDESMYSSCYSCVHTPVMNQCIRHVAFVCVLLLFLLALFSLHFQFTASDHDRPVGSLIFVYSGIPRWYYQLSNKSNGMLYLHSKLFYSNVCDLPGKLVFICRYIVG